MSKDLMDVPGMNLDAAAITITAYVTQGKQMKIADWLLGGAKSSAQFLQQVCWTPIATLVFTTPLNFKKKGKN
jgi:hypothetical protein